MAGKFTNTGDKRKVSSSQTPNSSNPPFKKVKFEPTQTGSKTERQDPRRGRDQPASQKRPGDSSNWRFQGNPKARGKSNGDSVPVKAFERGENSREAHAKQKQLAQERKAAKPLADELARTKKIWERLRLKSHVPSDERKKLVDELFGIITDRIKDFVLKHDAVRAVQTAIKYSTRVQRKQIAGELKGTYPQLAESRYAKFLIGKLLVHNDNEIRDLIIPEFYGKVRILINHPEASWILDDIYRTVATKEQKSILLREWYGAEFSLLGPSAGGADAETTAELSQILKKEPSKRSPIMKHLMDMVNALIQKKMTGFTMLHDAMLQYFLNLKPGAEEQKEFIEVVKEDEGGDLLKNMAFTKSGARLSCLLLAYGTAKDRKQILKTYKDTFQLMCGDANGHIVILAAYDLIDDTILTAKSILPELLGREGKEAKDIIFCANNLNARTTILYLFEGDTKALFPASHSADLEILKEIHEIRKTTSKKDDGARRKELITAMSPQLLSAIAASPRDLVSTSFGCQLVRDVLLEGAGDKAEALKAIAATAAGNPDEAAGDESYPESNGHISRTAFGANMFKTLIAGGRFDKQTGQLKPVDPPLRFANIIYPHIKDHTVAWATGPSSFVPLALLEANDFEEKDHLRKVLKANRKALETAATEETAEQRIRREATENGEKAAGKKSKKKGSKQELPRRNAGTRLLLEKL